MEKDIPWKTVSTRKVEEISATTDTVNLVRSGRETHNAEKEIPWVLKTKAPEVAPGDTLYARPSNEASIVRLNPVDAKAKNDPWCDAFGISPWACS
jgi:hypothetical protein